MKKEQHLSTKEEKVNALENAFPFKKANYLLMLVGIGTLIVGFFIMSIDSEPFGFGFLGLTLGPLVVFAGFILEIVAILYKGKAQK